LPLPIRSNVFANELASKAIKDGVYVSINPNAIKVGLFNAYQAWQKVFNDYSHFFFMCDDLGVGS
jgi:hypothetical protein